MVAQSALADSAEHKQLRESVSRLLADRAPLSALRAAPPTGAEFDADLWGRLAEIGLTALTMPEKYDGLGQTAVEAHVVFEELGRALYPGPYLATVGLAVPALLASGDDEAHARWLPGIAEGRTVGTLAVTEADGRWSTEHTTVTAAPGGECGWLLTGTKPVVLAGAEAGLMLVTARHDAGVSLFAVSGDATGLTRTPLETLDLARTVARVELDQTSATLVGTPGAAPMLVADVLDQALVALAAEQTGGAAACLRMCTDYAKTRQQFGRPIGSFQAVAHKLVEMLQGVEFSRACARYAAAAQAEGDAEFPVAARVAAAFCGEAFRAITVETVQAHGGIGFTWEHDTHLYYRRAWSAQQLFAGLAEHRAALAERLGL